MVRSKTWTSDPQWCDVNHGPLILNGYANLHLFWWYDVKHGLLILDGSANLHVDRRCTTKRAIVDFLTPNYIIIAITLPLINLDIHTIIHQKKCCAIDVQLSEHGFVMVFKSIPSWSAWNAVRSHVWSYFNQRSWKYIEVAKCQIKYISF